MLCHPDRPWYCPPPGGLFRGQPDHDSRVEISCYFPEALPGAAHPRGGIGLNGHLLGAGIQREPPGTESVGSERLVARRPVGVGDLV